MIRQPIICVMGHVDHGKTSLLDAIRSTAVARREAGAITQHIGASEVPIEAIRETCEASMGKAKCEGLKIPGLLFIDTPGHEAFTNLRKRGGSVADMAVLVVDIMQGFQPQTLEAMQILKAAKTPFLLAANKVDLIDGWKPQQTNSVLKSIGMQNDRAQITLDEKIYEIVGRLGQMGFESERFDRISDFRKQIAIIPVSAKTKEGLAELLMLLAGVTQKFLEDQLEIEVSGPGKGSILEVKEEKGLGKTIDVILYQGELKKNDTIVFGTQNGPKETKIRGLLKPKPMDEMRDPREKFNYVDEIFAASGVKINAPELDDALAGSSIFVVTPENREACLAEIQGEISHALVETTGPGVIVKADTLGSVEGMNYLFAAAGIAIRKASIGPVTKKDVIDAENAKNTNRYLGVLLAFNVEVGEEAALEAQKFHIPILQSNVIYTLLDEYNKWREKEKEIEKQEAYAHLILPAKFKILPGMCFRMKDPIVVGVEILEGRLRSGCRIMNGEGKDIGELKSIQKDKVSVNEAKKGDQVAISISTSFTFGRQICEDEKLFALVPKADFELLKSKFKEQLTVPELELLNETRRTAGDKFIL